MCRRRFVITVLVVAVISISNLHADDTDPAADATADAIRAAISKSIPQLEKGTAGSDDQRKCFTCHSQAVPVLALVEARERGFKIDKDNLARQVRHTAEHLKRGRKNYLEGRGQGGRVITAGYALWTLEAAGWDPDETTDAVTSFLLEYQKQADHWKHPGKRPPSSGSDFTTTYLALRGLAAFGTDERKLKIEARRKTVRKWLLGENPRDTEDRVFRLRALRYVDAGETTVEKATTDLIGSQLKDGGWAQKPDMKSDAYATATVLAALLQVGFLPADHPTVRRGVKYLVDTQHEDGTWHVVSRAKPFQTYFESGFPHGKDQFISITASSWATLALLLTLPESANGDD